MMNISPSQSRAQYRGRQMRGLHPGLRNFESESHHNDSTTKVDNLPNSSPSHTLQNTEVFGFHMGLANNMGTEVLLPNEYTT